MNDGANIAIELSRLQQIETIGYSMKKGDLSAIVLIWDIAGSLPDCAVVSRKGVSRNTAEIRFELKRNCPIVL